MTKILANIRNGNDYSKFNFSSPLPLCKGAANTSEWLLNTIKQKIKENKEKVTRIRNVSEDEKSKNDENNTHLVLRVFSTLKKPIPFSYSMNLQDSSSISGFS